MVNINNKDLMNSKLDSDIFIISQIITSELNALISIVLTGGYGRGEGAWITSSALEVKPYNDYDIYIISENPIELAQLIYIKYKLQSSLDVKWIDLDNLTLEDLKRLKNTMRNYDFKYGSKVIYGDSSILDYIPAINTKKISYHDIETLFFTRVWAFFGSFGNNGFTDLTNDESTFFKYQMAKAILALVDAVLIDKKKYELYYQKRVELLNKSNIDYKLNSLSQWALKEKFAPSITSLSKLEMQNLYNEVHFLFKEIMNKSLRKHYFFLNMPKSLNFIYIVKPYYFLRRIYHRLIRKTLDYEREILMRKSQVYIFYSYNYDDSINTKYFQKGLKYMSKIKGKLNIHDWHDARLILSEMRKQE